MTPPPIPTLAASPYRDAPNCFVTVGGVRFAYREFGPRGGIPLVLLNHWGAVLDNFDPRIVEGLAALHHVIALDYRGIGLSGGSAPLTVGEMARDVQAVIGALGFTKVDLLGFSLGGFVAQDVVLNAPGLLRKLILCRRYGHRSGRRISWSLIVKGLLTARDPKTYLFFTGTVNGRRAAKDFLARLKERKVDRDKAPTPRAFLRQLAAIKAWGRQAPQDLGCIGIPALVANGDKDIMVPTVNSRDLAQRIPNAELVLYPDAGHGGIFQYHDAFVSKALAFLAD